MAEIKHHEVYTTEETERLLKVSKSTIKRMLKKGLIRANKIGGQYRIMGHELLRVLSPRVDTKVTRIYKQVKQSAKQKTRNW